MLNNFNIIIANANPPRPSEVPARLAREVLDHDAAQDDELGVDAVEDAVVGEVEAVGDFDGEPGCDASWLVCVLVVGVVCCLGLDLCTEVLVCCQCVLGRFVVGFVNLIEPVAASLAVGFA